MKKFKSFQEFNESFMEFGFEMMPKEIHSSEIIDYFTDRGEEEFS